MMVARSCAVGWEGNRRSGVAPATRHRLCGIQLWAEWPKERSKEMNYAYILYFSPRSGPFANLLEM